MKLPSFAAEESLYNKRELYGKSASPVQRQSEINPAQIPVEPSQLQAAVDRGRVNLAALLKLLTNLRYGAIRNFLDLCIN
jgi:hypothetical protein